MRLYYYSAVVLQVWYAVAFVGNMFSSSWLSSFVSKPGFIAITMLVSVILVRPLYLLPPSAPLTTTRVKEVRHIFGVFMIAVGHVFSGLVLLCLIKSQSDNLYILLLLIPLAMFSYFLGSISARSTNHRFDAV